MTPHLRPNLVTKLVGMSRLELPTSTSRTWRATNCATSRLYICIYSCLLLVVFDFSRTRKGLLKLCSSEINVSVETTPSIC